MRALAAALLLVPSWPAGAAEEAPRLDCEVIFAPRGATTEGSGYTALVAGADGRVYAGSARYGGYGWLLELDPAARSLRKIVGLDEATGESQSGIHTQAKIHSKMSITADGRVIFSSKQGHEVFDTRPEYEDGHGYPGGHLLEYDPRTGAVRDRGILLPREGLIWAILDEPRGRVYLKSEPKNHFLSHDLKTGATTDVGNTGSGCRYLALDPRGVAYTVGREGILCRYDPEKGFLEDLPVDVEGAGVYRSPYVLAMAPGGRRLYGLVGGHPSVLEFDIESARDRVAVRNAAPVVGQGLENRDIHAAVFGKDGRLYFPVLTQGDVLHLSRFDPETRQVSDLGVPRPPADLDARFRHLYVRGESYRLDSIQGAAVGPDGTLYLMDIYPQLNLAVFPRLTAPGPPKGGG